MAEEKYRSHSTMGFRRHSNEDICSRTRLAFPDHATQSGICSTCIMCGICEIGKKAKEGKTIFPEPFGTAQFGAEKVCPNLEDLQIIPRLKGQGIFFHEVDTSTKIGGFDFRVPVSIAGMGSTIVAHSRGKALAEGAARAGIGVSIGENVLATHGEKGLKERIRPFIDSFDGKHGAIVVQGNVEDQRQEIFEKAVSYGAMGIELKIGQGAKQGLGGEIKFDSEADAERFRKLGYHVVKMPGGKFQRHSAPGSLFFGELRQLIEKYSSFGLPFWIKTGFGRGLLSLIEWIEKLKKEEKADIRCLTIDGFGGGTGMSPWLVMNEIGLPSGAVFSALNKKVSFDILLAGGYTSGIDVCKAMLLGASGSAMSRPFLIAANTDKKQGVEKYCEAMAEEMRMICATQRAKSVSELKGKKDSLYALSEEAEKVFGLSSSLEKILK